MAKILLAYLAESQYENLEYGMARGIWGLPPSIRGFPRKFDYVIISSRIKPGGPRRPSSEWRSKTITVTVAQRAGPLSYANSLLWPDEVTSGKVRYKIRFPVKHVVTHEGVRTDDSSILPRRVSNEIRKQAVNGGAPVIHVADEVLANSILS